MYNGRPMGAKKTVRLMVALTILAWATQTLMHQWGFGQEAGAEKFVPSGMGFGSTVELRSEVKIIGNEVKFRQLFRWADGDKAVFGPMADMTVAKLGKDAAFQSFALAELRQILRETGVNIAMLRFAGAVECRVTRTDVTFDERNALDQWINAKQLVVAPQSTPIAATPDFGELSRVASPVLESGKEAMQASQLRDQIVADLAQRLNLPADTLQLTFDPKDDRLLNLSEPNFRFKLFGRKARDLGTIIYDLTITSDGHTQRVTISAEARAWQKQVLVARPLAFKQVIREEDLTEQRVLVDRLAAEPLVALQQTIGQQAARDVKPGMVLTSRMIEGVPMVKTGQLVTVHLTQGTIQLTNVARAMENGSYGQTIRVKNESTKDIYDVTVIGPQTATISGELTASAR